MQLKDNFFSIIETANTPDSMRCRVRMNAESEIYRSHFPGNPVTPGVCLVQMACEIFEHLSHKRLSLTDVPKIRFKQVVLPNDEPWFTFTGITEEQSTLNLGVTVSTEQVEYAKMSLKYHIINDEKQTYDKVCVVVPTYNNAGTIIKTIQDVYAFCKDIIVVNDGCTDETDALLAECEYPITTIEFKRNRGKGHAIVAGIRKAKEKGFTHVITIDADGQHFASDIPLFLAEMRKDRASIVIGSRDFNEENMPRQNTFANKFSNFWFRLQTGLSLSDTQSGFRLYPIEHLCNLNLVTSRYEGELALLVFSAWKGTNIVSIPVKVYYPAKEERVSHFHPVYDFARISVLNTVLCVAALFYGWPSLLLRKIRKG